MSKATVSLDSYQLAQYAVQVPCYICEGGNNHDAELCRYCQAPMALAHQARAQKVHPQMIATIGTADAGKTVYLGMLTDMLSRQAKNLHLTARGAFSVSLQQHTIASLSRCRFPAKTPNEPDRWNWVHCQVRMDGRRQPAELIMPDLAGEAILEEIDHPGTYPVIKAFLSRCVGLMLLVDSARLEEGENDQDFFTMKIVTYLTEMHRQQPSGKKGRKTAPLPAVSIVFTKADHCDESFEDPAAYARRRTPGLFQLCKEQLPKHEFFAACVVGAYTYRWELETKVQVPLRIEPRGIIPPFAWLMQQLPKT